MTPTPSSPLDALIAEPDDEEEIAIGYEIISESADGIVIRQLRGVILKARARREHG